MSGTDLAVLAAVVVLVLLTALAAACETIIARLGLVRALRLAEERARGADRLLWLLEHRGTSLGAMLTLTVASRVTAAALATVLALRLLPGAAGVAVAIVATIVLSLVVGEVVPRTLAQRDLERAGLRLASVASLVVRAVAPVARVFAAAGRLLARQPEPDADDASDDGGERRDHGDGADEDDEIEDEERAMIRSIFELGDTVTREIMVPRPDMVAVDETAPLRELVNTIVEHGHSRIPVHRESRDTIVGVVYAKDVLERVAMQPGRDHWRDLVRPATFVPETKRVDDLLRDLQERAVHLAIVADEYGDLVGLVTIEDILEEIVGEIVDEHDREEPLVEVLENERMRIDARLPVDDLNELLDADLPDDGWDTVGGLVFGMLGRVPAEGDAVDIDRLTVTVERVQGRRVSKVLVARRHEPDVAEVEAAGPASHDR